MEYFGGLDVSMAETHVCVVTRTGAVVRQAKVPSTPADIAAELAQVPTCRRILFETGRMAPMLYHGLSQFGLPVVCVESWLVRASDACRRLMSIPGVGQLTALAFTAAVDDPQRFRRSRDIGAYLGLVPRRYQSGEIDYTGSISKCGDRRLRTLLYEAANVMLTRYKGTLKLKDWAFAIAKRSTMRKARIALARRLAIIMHSMLRHGTEFKPA
jgi:transposase